MSDAYVTITEGLSESTKVLKLLDEAEERQIDIQRRANDEILCIRKRREAILQAVEALVNSNRKNSAPGISYATVDHATT
jgi:murein tripeptide amidase MpaA